MKPFSIVLVIFIWLFLAALSESLYNAGLLLCLLESALPKLCPWHQKTQTALNLGLLWQAFFILILTRMNKNFIHVMVFSSALTSFCLRSILEEPTSLLVSLVALRTSYCKNPRDYIGTNFYHVEILTKLSTQCLCHCSWLQLLFRHPVGAIFWNNLLSQPSSGTVSFSQLLLEQSC